jgi:hypothetical protein
LCSWAFSFSATRGTAFAVFSSTTAPRTINSSAGPTHIKLPAV